MSKTRYKGILRPLAAALCLVLLFALAGCANSPDSFAADGSGSDMSDASDVSGAGGGDASVSTSETEPTRPLLAEGGEGIYQPPEDPMAAAVCLVNEDTGLVVYEKNSHTQLPAASLVKMLTCVLVVEQAQKFGWDLETTLVDSSNKGYIWDDIAGKNASHADIRQGETLSLWELLHAALLPSGNEAAMLLADFACSGYMPNFLYMLNTRAKTLGCTATWFDDVSGLSELSVTTASDMVKITREFMKHPVLVEIASAGTFTITAHEKHNYDYTVHTTNRLVVASSPYYKLLGSAAGSIVAGKTGSLGEWQNFASKASKNGESYICVVLQSPDIMDLVAPALDPPGKPRPGLCETATLYNWAFSTFTVTSALDITQPVKELKVRYSTEADTVRLMPDDDIKTLVPVEDPSGLLRRVYNLPEWLAAPITEGQQVGSVTLLMGGHEIGTTTLTAARSIERNETMHLFAQIGTFFRSTYFKVLLGILLILLAVYAAGVALVMNSRARKKRQAAGPAPPGQAGKKPPPGGRKRRAPPGQAAQQGKQQKQQAAGRPKAPPRNKPSSERKKP